jgi:hypothetical protein
MHHSRVVYDDATLTASNIIASPALFRRGLLAGRWNIAVQPFQMPDS